MNRLLIVFVASLLIVVQCDPKFDFRAVKYFQRNAHCYMNIYQPTLESADHPSNTFIRQVYNFNCFNFHVVRAFTLLSNGNGGYDVYCCFYFREKQTIKCGYFKGNQDFKLDIDYSFNDDYLKNVKKPFIYIDQKNDTTQNGVRIYSENSGRAVKWEGGKLVNETTIGFVGPLEWNAIVKVGFGAELNNEWFNHFSFFGDVYVFKLVGYYKIHHSVSQFWQDRIEWKEDFDYVFDNNQAPGKVNFPFTKNYVGIKYVNPGNGKCYVDFTVLGSQKNKGVAIECMPIGSAVSFNINWDVDERYRLRTCFLNVNNTQNIRMIQCFVLNRFNTFLHELTHHFKRCRFDGENVGEHANILIGAFRGSSTKLNGIVIDYAKTSCILKMDKDVKVVKEIVDDADKYGRGFDIIRDDFLVRSKLPFDLTTKKKLLADDAPIMSTGSNVFIKARENKWIVYNPRGEDVIFNGDYDAIIDDSYIKLV